MADESVASAAVIDAPASAAPETTPAPIATAPVAEAAPAVTVDPETKMRDAVAREMNKIPGFEVTKPEPVKTPEQLAEEKAKVEEQPKTDEEKAAAEKAEADAKAAEAAKANEVKVENPLDKAGPLPVEVLAKAVEDPEFAAALEKVGIDPELLFETSRRAAFGDQLVEAGATTPEVVKLMSESAEHFYDLEEQFPKIQSVQDFDKFVTGTLLPLSVVYGQDGKPLMTADGKGYQTDGSIARFMDTAAQFDTVSALQSLDAVIAHYSKVPGEEGESLKAEAERLKEAFTLTQSFRDNGYKLAGQKAASGERSAADQALIDKLQKDSSETERVRTEAQQQADVAFQDSVFNDTVAASSPFLKGVLDRTSLNANEKRDIEEKVFNEVFLGLKDNRHFQMQKQNLYNQGNTPEIRQAILALTKPYFETAATKAMNRLVTEYGGKVISANQKKQHKIDTQTANDRMNQGTGTTPGAKPVPVLTAAQTREQAIANLKGRGLSSPDDGEILTEVMAIKGLSRTA